MSKIGTNPLLKQPMSRRQFIQFGWVAALSLFGVIRVISQLRSYASGTPIGFESESGGLSGGAVSFGDSTASGANAVRFGRSNGYTRPSTSDYVRYESLQTGSLSLGQVFAAVPNGKKLSLPAGVFSFSDFAYSNVYGQLPYTHVTGWAGSGISDTTFEMVPGSSTKVALVPVQSTGSTNPLYLMRVDQPAAGGLAVVQGFTLLGTDQPQDPNTGSSHIYNGLISYQTTGAELSDLKIKAIPGNSAANPGETFSYNDYRGVGNTLRNVEIDGYKSTGVRTAASLVGLNYSNGFNALDCNWHGSKYGAGITHYKCSGVTNLTNVRSEDNLIPYNFESNGGLTVNMRNCTSLGNRSRTTNGAIVPIFAVVDSDVGSTVMNIYDPIIDMGTPTPANPLVIVLHSTYGAGPNKQLQSDIHLILNGVERRDCVRFASNETIVYT